MNYLIVFMSHHGTTRKVAYQLARDLGEQATTIVDLNTDVIPDVNTFDTVIIGGSVHFGRIQKKVKEFCAQYQDVLLTKRVGLFLCALEDYEMDMEFEAAFPQWIRNHAVAKGIFGGEIVFDKMNLIEKAFVKSIYGINGNKSDLNQDAIHSFEETIRN